MFQCGLPPQLIHDVDQHSIVQGTWGGRPGNSSGRPSGVSTTASSILGRIYTWIGSMDVHLWISTISIYHTCIAIGTIVIHIAYTRQNTFGKDSAYKHRPPCRWQQNGSFLVSPSTSQQFYRIMGHGDLYRSSGESWFAKSDSPVDPYVPGCYIQFLSVLKGTWKSRLPRINLLAACLRSVATSRSSIRDSGTNKIGSYWP